MADTDSKTASANMEGVALNRAARLIAFNTWRQDWRAQNPEASKADRKDAWTKVRGAEVRKARKALRQMQRNGIALVAA